MAKMTRGSIETTLTYHGEYDATSMMVRASRRNGHRPAPWTYELPRSSCPLGSGVGDGIRLLLVLALDLVEGEADLEREAA